MLLRSKQIVFFAFFYERKKQAQTKQALPATPKMDKNALKHKLHALTKGYEKKTMISILLDDLLN